MQDVVEAALSDLRRELMGQHALLLDMRREMDRQGLCVSDLERLYRQVMEGRAIGFSHVQVDSPPVHPLSNCNLIDEVAALRHQVQTLSQEAELERTRDVSPARARAAVLQLSEALAAEKRDRTIEIEKLNRRFDDLVRCKSSLEHSDDKLLFDRIQEKYISA